MNMQITKALMLPSAKVNQLLADLAYQERLLAESINATSLREGNKSRTQRRDMIHRLKSQVAKARVAQ